MSASEDKWEEDKRVREENLKTYNELWAKAGFDGKHTDWTHGLLKDRLQTWEYYFLLASMFGGVSDNGGLVHGLHCYFDDADCIDVDPPAIDVLDCWKAIGCLDMIKAYEVGRSELKRRGVKRYDELSFEQEQEVEEALYKALEEFGKVNLYDVRLAAYAAKNKSGESSSEE